MNPFPSNWHLPEYPILTLAFFIACFVFMMSTYSVITGLMVRGDFIAIQTKAIYTGFLYRFRPKADVILGSLSFAYIMGFIFYN